MSTDKPISPGRLLEIVQELERTEQQIERVYPLALAGDHQAGDAYLILVDVKSRLVDEIEGFGLDDDDGDGDDDESLTPDEVRQVFEAHERLRAIMARATERKRQVH